MVAGVALDPEKFKKSERRLTPQRQAVLKAFLELSREHPTAESIYHVARRYCPTVGMATVYRSLDLFVQMGIIVKAPTLNGTARYEMNQTPHNHFICLKCGRTYEFRRRQEPLVEREIEKAGFEVISASIIFFGYCPACRE
ncbi:Transcriptional regulator PerR [Moorella thermoacetica]|uniref:Transcriptional regulator PerR n=1 Tax=Neomoorella thermoacetica TaxID=1525 RepID=A0AAC9HHS5_NEOTH|nr:transcriptional repressor [Moorella thermoacetica]AOQ24142.1 Transcriptional regulator PerR [Moorella thermoacetica]OIQ61387.1 transcriptional regulator PerR [Moorella thermoacetica]TYL14548.1 Transcriptional regulator PerR [Moorella thermoacetica]